ncbi:hypothetical protein GALL_75750 [mine drainage metagenome]|uniref:MASE1 domain-containing protein n=1 Tax=mine drainage metagenome TaxID=410659 RepID=A0A1J5TAJ0_9ZZZZ
MTNESNSGCSPASLYAITGVALAYWLLYQLNDWLFTNFEVSRSISWVFLPAALRMVAVLLFGWDGVAGLLSGSIVMAFPWHGDASVNSCIVSALSSMCPMLAVTSGAYLMKTKADLHGLRAKQLFVFAFLGALFNSVVQNLYFQMSGTAKSWLTGLVPMFVGDFIGTMIALYCASMLIRLLLHFAAKQPPAPT